MQLTENELNELKRMMETFGFKYYKSAYFLTADYKNLRNTFLDTIPTSKIKFNNIKICSINTVKRIGKNILIKHTEGIDTKVAYTPLDELESDLIAKFGKTPEEDKIDEILNYINKHIKQKEVTKIPLTTNINNIHQNGRVIFTHLYNHFQDPKYNKNLPNIIKEIDIEGPINDFTKGIYVHEMYHALTSKNKGYTQNYLYDETLSIFMEKVTALEMDKTYSFEKEANLQRLLLTKDNILNLETAKYHNTNHLPAVEMQKYITSNILATDLFNTYSKNSNKIKNEINNDINQVLSGKKILEDILDKYEIYEEKGAKIMRKQLKTYTKEGFK